jgi:hypothetical protein
MEGWIKLYRKFSEWEWFNISEMVHLFIYLLLNANHEEGEWRGVLIKRGQILTGLNSLQQNTKISYQKLRTCLKRLEKTKEINIQVTNKYSIITICNYESYQDCKQTTNNQSNIELTLNEQATNIELTTNNNKENKDKEKNIIPPPIFLITRYCKERNNDIDPEYFYDWYQTRGWKVGKDRMKDWQSAIRTWEKRNKKKEPKLMMP